MKPVSAMVAALVLISACSRDQGPPSTEQNRQLDSAENLLDEAPNQLESVGESLPAEQ